MFGVDLPVIDGAACELSAGPNRHEQQSAHHQRRRERKGPRVMARLTSVGNAIQSASHIEIGKHRNKKSGDIIRAAPACVPADRRLSKIQRHPVNRQQRDKNSDLRGGAHDALCKDCRRIGGPAWNRTRLKGLARPPRRRSATGPQPPCGAGVSAALTPRPPARSKPSLTG